MNASTADPTMSPQEVAEAACALIDALAPLLNGAPHSVALIALLSLVRALGERHTCCTARAAMDCATVAAELWALTKNPSAPSGAALHRTH